MCDQKHRAIRKEIHCQVLHLHTRHGVGRGELFVKQDNRAIFHQGARESHALALPAGKAGR